MFCRCFTIPRHRRGSASAVQHHAVRPRLSSRGEPPQTSSIPFIPLGMETNVSTQNKKENPNLLCLKCRKAGHNVSTCPTARWPRDEFAWFFSEERKLMEYGTSLEDSNREICKRCQDLNILQFLQKELPWGTTSDLNKLAAKGTDKFQNIGKTWSIEFWDNCPLCVCLFALTPSPSSATQDVLLLSDWSMNRLAGETPTVADLEGWSQFPKCLLITLSKDSTGMEFNIGLHRGDALCVVEEDSPDHVLGGRLISPDRLQIGTIKSWLDSCDKLHIAKFRPAWTQYLPDIKFVQVATREVVRAPEISFDYLALSYVWGGVTQRSYKLGSKLARLPQTLEDAIDLTRSLGKEYLWVDSLCIDQADEKDKDKQIMTMKDIYSGAYLTIIALSGKSAHAGLPRLKESKNVFSQLACCVDGKRLVGVMPTLSQQIWRAPWGQRAWTLQEALLAPRCLYISDHQLYFECNGMQCCESLDDTRSWAHHLSLEANPGQGGWLASKVGDGCLRTPIDLPSHRLERYGSKLTLYSYRSMTNPMDGLNAFSGIIQFLETMYPKERGGFHVGPPVEDFQWGLLWRSQYPPIRRPGFPTWSWAGWQGGLWPGYPFDYTKPHEYPLHLRMWKALDNRLVQFFQTSYVEHFPNDPITRASRQECGNPNFDFFQYSDAERNNYLFAEAIMLEFAPDYRRPISDVYSRAQASFFVFRLRRTPCLIGIMSMDAEVDKPPSQEKKRFILLARDYRKEEGLVYHHLLMVHILGETAIRETQLDLIIPVDNLDILDECQPQKRRLVMA